MRRSTWQRFGWRTLTLGSLRRRSRPRLPLILLLIALSVPAAVFPQLFRTDASQGPTDKQESSPIRVTTRLVQIGVIVRDKNGPVLSLTKDNFRVLERGKVQTISVFTPEGGTGTGAALASPVQMLPRGTFSNLPQYSSSRSGSVTVVLLDNLNTLYGSTPESPYESAPFWIEDLALQNAKNHLTQFISELKPEDRVALYGLTNTLHVLADFTNDREQLLAILKKYDTAAATNRAVVEPGHKRAPVLDHQADPFENGAALSVAGAANETRAERTEEALAAIARHVANIPGRKNLVWLTADLPLSGVAMARILSPANIAVYPVDARGLLALAEDTRPPSAGGDLVAEERSHFRNAPAQTLQPIGIPEMRDLARETGGQAFVNTNDITGAIRKAVEDSEVTYTLGFYVDANLADGKFHELKVEVKPSETTVLYPAGYFAYREEPANAAADRNSITTAMRSPIESSAIPLTASFERATQGTNEILRVQGRIELGNIGLAEMGEFREGALDVDAIQQDATGKVLVHSLNRIGLRFTREGYGKALRQGVTFQKAIPLRPGATTLRLLVEDPSTAEVGSLIVPLAQIK